MSKFKIGNNSRRYVQCQNPDCEEDNGQPMWFWGDGRDKYCCDKCRIHYSNKRHNPKRKKKNPKILN